MFVAKSAQWKKLAAVQAIDPLAPLPPLFNHIVIMGQFAGARKHEMTFIETTKFSLSQISLLGRKSEWNKILAFSATMLCVLDDVY